MSQADPVQCPVCGWTGQDADLERIGGDPVCPVCNETVAIE